MKRRDFLKILSVAPAIAAIPLSANANTEMRVKVDGGLTPNHVTKLIEEINNNLAKEKLYFKPKKENRIIPFDDIEDDVRLLIHRLNLTNNQY